MVLLLRTARLLRAGVGWQGAGAFARIGARGLASTSPSRQVLEHRPVIAAAHSGPAYTLQVITGDRRGASTTAKVHARLIGTEGEAGPYTLQGDFYRATMQSFYVETAKPIGQLLRVEIGHDASEIGSGWFLDKVVVECHTTGLVSEFPCEAWLGESDSGGCDGPLARELHERRSAIHSERQRSEWTASVRELRLAAAAATLPRTDKLRKGQRSKITAHLGWGGEDAYFIAPQAKGGRGGSQSSEVTHWMMGVADGVGSWEAQGIDAGKYSRSLIEAALGHFDRVLHSGPRVSESLSALEEVVHLACADTVAAQIKGSSTLCVVHIDGLAATLAAANIGDSGFIVIRQGLVAYRSAQQEHSFGCPFQLGHHESASPPSDAQLTKIPIEPGDTVVLGSDGLFDNLSDADIAHEAAALNAACEQQGKRRDCAMARQLANRLVERALTASLDESKETPFAKAATEEFGLVYRGGKQDDITVVVGLLNESAGRPGLPP